ncbi:hypothetical protein ACSYDW_00775 [Paeniglutamicibacter sp. R2-26]|uniref:hypothetical protein n=1 Tax=Paeniglutamicibacter sp. R2-26 TaxID=3144417 RepID=UPI003EE5347F
MDIHNGSIVARLDTDSGRSSVMRSVKTLVSSTVALDFGINQGLDGLQHTASLLKHDDARLAFHDLKMPGPPPHAANKTNDILKPYRAAAFAGARVIYPEAD